jgi:hypothetical protein
MIKAVVGEEEYGVVATIPPDPEDLHSDRIAAGIRISMVMRARGREASVVPEDDGAISVRVPLGDAPESEYDAVASELLEATSW